MGQYYFHQFSVKQPDLNWENEKVRRAIYDMILWWMDKGVGGFRLDVIDQIAKEPDLGITNNGPRLHEFIQELSRETFQEGGPDHVGEAWGADPERAKLYSNPDGSEFSMVFQFEHICLDQQEGKEKWDLAPLSLVKLKENLPNGRGSLWIAAGTACSGTITIFPGSCPGGEMTGNTGGIRENAGHCAPRMKGTPYIYQGEELGMTNVRFPDISHYRDIETLNMYRERKAAGYPEAEIMASLYAKSRDNARTPMQWDDGVNAGFTEGTPWIEVNPNYPEITPGRRWKMEILFTIITRS